MQGEGCLMMPVDSIVTLDNPLIHLIAHPHSPNATEVPSSASSVNSRGTTAAIALACVLTFILLAALFSYFLVCRPRLRRRAYERQTQYRREKEAEAGDVFDVSAEPEDTVTRQAPARTSLPLAGL